MGHAILKDILIIFAAAIPVVLLVERLRIPAIVGFLLTGIAIGPHALGWIRDVNEIQVLADIGVALLLFGVGLEFSFDRLRGWGRSALVMGVVQVSLVIGIGLFCGVVFKFGWLEGAFLGSMLALSSTAIVMALLSAKRLYDAPAGRIAIGVLILQDLAVIPIMVLLQFFTGSGVPGELPSLATAVLHLIGLGAALIIVERFAIRPLLHYISRPRGRELFVVVVVGIALGAAFATSKLGLSFALGAFVAGMLISLTEFRFHVLSEIAPFRNCFNGIFFVALGMLVEPFLFAQHPLSMAGMVLGIIAFKAIIIAAVILAFGYPFGIAGMGGMMLAQMGEFSFVIAVFGVRTGIIAPELYGWIVGAAALTMMLTPTLMAAAPRVGGILGAWRFRWGVKRGERVPSRQEPEKLSGHAIICGFGPLGMTVGKLLEERDVPYVILELNPQTAAKLKLQGRKHVYIGDGASSVLLEHSRIDRACLLAIAIPDYLNALAILKQARTMNQDIFIVTRCRYRDQVQRLYEHGADVVVCEELEAGIEMGRYVLQALGAPQHEVAPIIDELRAFGSADFF